MIQLRLLLKEKLPAHLRPVILNCFLTMIVPAMLTIAIPVIVFALVLAEGQLFRTIPATVGALLILLAGWLFKKGHLKAAAYIVLSSGGIAIMTGMLMGGGFASPSSYGAIPFTIAVACLFGNRAGLIGFVTLLIVTIGFTLAQLNGWLQIPSAPHPLFLLGTHTAWLVVGFIAITVPMGLLTDAVRKSAEATKSAEAARQNAEEARQRAEAVQHQSFQMVVLMQPTGALVSANQTALDFSGIEADDVVGQMFEDTPWWDDDRQRLRQAIQEAASGERSGFDTVLITPQGEQRNIDFTIGPFYDGHGEITYLIAEMRDVTELMRMKSTLAQREKLDSIGELAGGIAHDFNNMLSGIIGTAETLRKFGPGDQTHFNRSMNTLLMAAERASSLTGKLLVFSRRKTGEKVSLSFHHVLKETVELLQHTIDRRIRIVCTLNAAQDTVNLDVAEMQNVLINLAVNARDAMPTCGQITIKTENTHLSPEEISSKYPNLTPGAYLKIIFQDTGCGIDAATQKHIFEPFFTTKSAANGTGVGLSTVYGTMRAHQGCIEVHSRINRGTSFELLLPLSSALPGVTSDAPQSYPPQQGSVLVIDDEEIVLDATEMMLRSFGYTVLTAQCGSKGIELFETHRNEIALVLLDMMMPEMDGSDVFKRLRRIDPEVKVILATGYAPQLEVEKMMKNGLVDVLKKPYRRSHLMAAIRASETATLA